MSLNAGVLRHRVTIQQRVDVQDGTTGEITSTWADVWARIPAAIEPLSAREYIASQVETARADARVTLRYRPGVTAAMRLLHHRPQVDSNDLGFDVYNILGVLPDKDSGREYLTLPVSRGVNEG